MSKVQALFYLGYWLGFAICSWLGVQYYIYWEAKHDEKEKRKSDCG